MDLQPTLLIDQEHLSPSTRRLLAASNNRNAYIPRKGTLANIFCAKAIYRGDRPGDGLFGDATLEINVAPARGRLPILDDEIATELQRAAAMWATSAMLCKELALDLLFRYEVASSAGSAGC